MSFLALVPVHAGAQCPQGSWHGFGPQGWNDPPITTAKLDATIYAWPLGPPAPVPWGELHLDQASGNGSMSIGGGMRSGEICGGSPTASMNTADDFVLLGPVSGSPIEFSAVWHLTGTIEGGIVNLPTLPPFCASGTADCTLTANAQTTTKHYVGCPNPLVVAEDVTLPLSVATGSHFSLTTVTQVHGDCDGHGAGLGWQLRFVGLPPNYQVTSCWGFATEAPTPNRYTSWGAVKQHYR